MKVIRALLGALAQGMNGPVAQAPPESGLGVATKSPPAYRSGSMLGAFLTETVSYHH
jgi:hypothetical protein